MSVYEQQTIGKLDAEIKNWKRLFGMLAYAHGGTLRIPLKAQQEFDPQGTFVLETSIDPTTGAYIISVNGIEGSPNAPGRIQRSEGI